MSRNHPMQAGVLENIERRYGKNWRRAFGPEAIQDIIDAEMYRAFLTAATYAGERPVSEINEFVRGLREEVMQRLEDSK